MANKVKTTNRRVINKIATTLKAIGVENPRQFYIQTGISQKTAYRIWSDNQIYPKQQVIEQILSAYDLELDDILQVEVVPTL